MIDEPKLPNESIVFLGVVLIVVGFILAIVVLLFSSRLGGGKTQGGAVVLIGPFPIVFGSNPQVTKSLLILAILLLAGLVAFFLLQQFRFPSS